MSDTPISDANLIAPPDVPNGFAVPYATAQCLERELTAALWAKDKMEQLAKDISLGLESANQLHAQLLVKLEALAAEWQRTAENPVHSIEKRSLFGAHAIALKESVEEARQ